MPPPYTSYAALAAEKTEGVDYTRTAVSAPGYTWAAIAIHGDRIEAGSGEVAQAVSVSGARMAYYEFGGIQAANNFQLHITSSLFDEPMCLALVAGAERVLSFHGYVGTTGVAETALGGLDVQMRERLRFELTRRGFTVVNAPSEIAGTNPANICNKGATLQGVQLEMSRTQREAFFPNGDTSSTMRYSGARTRTFTAYVEAVVAAMCEPGPAYTMGVDWSGDGTFTGTAEDVTPDLLEGTPITYVYGRDQNRQLSPPAVGTMAFALCNTSRVYSPENPGSPLAGDFTPSSPARMQVDWDTVTYPLGTGQIEDYELHPDRGNRSVDVTVLDGLGHLDKVTISTGVYAARRTGELMHVVLDAAGWTGPRDIGLGATFVPWWWLEAMNAFTAVQDLVRAEGPPSIAYISPDGTFTFRDRHHRLLREASLSAQATFEAQAVDCAHPVSESTHIGRLVGLASVVTIATDDFAQVTVPGTVAVGDLLLVGCVMPSGTRTFAISGGGGAWTSLGSAAQSGHTSQMWWRIATAADVGATITVTPSSPNIRQVLMLGKVTGADPVDPVVGATAIITPVTVAGVTTPTVAAVPAGSREVSVLWDSRGASTPNTSDWAAPTGQTRHLQAFTTDGSGSCSGAMGDSNAVGQGVVGSRLWVPDRGAVGSAWTIAVRGIDPDTVPLSYTDPFVYTHGGRDIINSVDVQVEERRPSGEWEPVWSSDSAFGLTLGESTQVRVTTSDPFQDVLDLVVGTDVLHTGPGTLVTSLSRRSGQSLVINLLAVGGATTVTYLQVRARSLPVARTLQVTQNDAVSIGKHGPRSAPALPPEWIGQHDASSVGLLLLAHYAERRPTVQMRVVAADDAHLIQMLTRTISDRVRIINGELGMDSDFHVEQVQHTVQRITPGTLPDPVHAVVLGCEQATQSVLNPFTFDKAGAGFDDGVFDPTAADDPSRIFIFDHPVQGQFGVGAFAT